MFSTVYMHKTVRIASSMLGRAIRRGADAGELKPEDFLSAGDEEMLLRLAGLEGSGTYARAIIDRKFYKQALEVSDLHPLLREPENAERELSEKCGCDIVIGMPNAPAQPSGFGVKGKGGMESIMEASELVAALLSAEERRRNAIIMCPEDARAKVEKAAKKHFGQ
jgi:HD superfamily phosphohydrolase